MKLKILSIFLCFSLLFPLTKAVTTTFANQESGTGIENMSPEELFEFYKTHKDYGKKRIQLDYQKYIDGEWVVFRGEYYDQKHLPLANKLIELKLLGNKYATVTNEKGIFNIEIPKKDLEDTNGVITLYVDNFFISTAQAVWSDSLKKLSIFHFEINRVGDYTSLWLSIKTIHNNLFPDGTDSFFYTENVENIPSSFGIQGVSFYILLVLLSILFSVSYFKFVFSATEKTNA